MTNPNPQPQPPRDERQDELIASVIAFAAIGTVLFLGLGRLGTGQLFSTQRLIGVSEKVTGSEPLIGDSAPFGLARGDRDDLQVERDSDLDTSRTVRRDENDDDVLLRQRPAVTRDRTPSVIAVAPDARTTTPEAPLASTEADVATVEEDAQQTEPVPTATSNIEPLADLPSGYWATPFIDRLVDANIIAGFNDNTFRPEQPVTRAEFAAQLAQAFPMPENADGTVDYSDVESDYWAADSIRQVSRDEFMSGYPEGDFRPFESVSRLEVLIALVSGLPLDQPEAVQDILSTYSDQGQIPEWAAPKIAAATEGNLVVNHPEPNSLNPSQPATRAETAAMLHQALVQQGKLEPVASEYIVQPE